MTTAEPGRVTGQGGPPRSAIRLRNIYNTALGRAGMHRLSTLREVFAHFRMRKKLYMLPVLLLLVALMGLTVMAQSGLAAFVYPI